MRYFLVIFLLSAKLFDATLFLFVSGLSAAGIVVFVSSWFTALLFDIEKRHLFAIFNAVFSLVVISILAYIFMFKALAELNEERILEAVKDVEYWDLDTGSTLAVRINQGASAKQNDPIIYLHGGPGAYSIEWTPAIDAISNLASDGFDVYFYDQVGGGLSERLYDISEYSLERHVADLEGIRKRIGAEKIILIGTSWGATLSANYMARYPSRVSKVIFSGPGPIFLPEWEEGSDGGIEDLMNPQQKQDFEKMIHKSRLFIAIILENINPIAAVNFAPESEMSAFFDQVANTHYMPLTTCEPIENPESPSIMDFGQIG